MKGLALVLGLLPLAASAATITVNSNRDNTNAGNGACTLREAVANVNAATDTTNGDCTAGTGTGDTVVFNLHFPARIVLGQGGPLYITRAVDIVGPAPSANGRLRLNISAHGPVEATVITLFTTVNISNLTIRSKKGSGYAFETFSTTATLTNCILDGAGNDVERAVENTGQLTMIGCTVKGARGSGGVANSGELTMIDCTISGNRGDSVDGAGIYNWLRGTLTMTGCTVRNNRALGQASGGGIYNSDGTVMLSNSTFYENRGNEFGGAIFNLEGTVTMTNCTFYKNTVGPEGRGAAIESFFGTVGRYNIIFAQTPGSRQPLNCDSFQTTLLGDHNISSDLSCFGGFNVAPNLAPFGDYGGPTKTMALCTGVGVPHRSCLNPSPAIDTGDDAVTGPPDNLSTDQRGLPRQVGAHVDIGAYEVQ